MLRLKAGWRVKGSVFYNAPMYLAPGVSESVDSAHVVDYSGTAQGSQTVYVRPFGSHRNVKWCDTLEEAHAYLIAVGSESPWEEV